MSRPLKGQVPAPESPAQSPLEPLTRREEEYVVARASGAPPEEAYRRAYTWRGKSSCTTEAGRLERRPRVAARLQALRDEYARRVIEASRGKVDDGEAPRAYSVAAAMGELDEAMALAKEKGNPGAMAKVVEVRMRLYGLGVADARNPLDERPMTPDEINQALRELREMKERALATSH